jgi:dTDP-4-dehydrorhamnose 3,5-epimerase
LLVGLLDVRQGSRTTEALMRITLGVAAATLLYIPRGVAHGVANVDTRPGMLVYLANTAFDPNLPDEHRLPYDALGAEFWSKQPG